MDAGPGTELGTLGWFLGIWLVMMAAMMFPSVAPTVALYSTDDEEAHRRLRRWCSCAGYLLTWTAAGLLAFGDRPNSVVASSATRWPGIARAGGWRAESSWSPRCTN